MFIWSWLFIYALLLKKSFKYYNHSALPDQSFYLGLRLGEAWLGVSRGKKEVLDKTKGGKKTPDLEKVVEEKKHKRFKDISVIYAHPHIFYTTVRK